MIVFYVKYIPGNIYNNGFSSGGADIIGVLFSGYLYSKLGMKLTFTTLLTISAIGGVCIMILGDKDQGVLMPIFVMLTKFGVTGGFVVVYVATA